MKTRLTLMLVVVGLVVGCHNHANDAEGLDEAVAGLTEWAGGIAGYDPNAPMDGASINEYLQWLDATVDRLKALCTQLEAIRDAGDFPELGDFDCAFPPPPAGGDDPPTNKPPEWP